MSYENLFHQMSEQNRGRIELKVDEGVDDNLLAKRK